MSAPAGVLFGAVSLTVLAACSPASGSPSPELPGLSPSAAAAAPTPAAVEPVQWLARLDVPGRSDCYAVKVDFMRVLTSLECARPGVVEFLRLELDPTSTSFVVGARSVVLPFDFSSAPGREPIGVAMVLFRKPGNSRASLPLLVGGVPPGTPLRHVVVPPPLESGKATGYGMSVPVEMVEGVAVPPGVVAVAPVSGGYESAGCNVGSGTPILVDLPSGPALAGVVSRPGSCDGSVPSLVSLVDYWTPWIVGSALCSQSQQSFSVPGSPAALSCSFSAL